IDQETNSKVIVDGKTNLDAGTTGDIKLDNNNNNFKDNVYLKGKDISLLDSNGDLKLADIVAKGTLDITATNGDIKQSSNTSINADGHATYKTTKTEAHNKLDGNNEYKKGATYTQNNPDPKPEPEPKPDPDPTPDPEPKPDPDPTPDPEPKPDNSKPKDVEK